MPEFSFPEKFTPLLPDDSGNWPVYRWAFAYGGRGGGKSRSFASLALMRARLNPTRFLCCREVQNSIRESVHLVLRDEIERQGLGSNGTGEFQVLENEIRHRNGSLFLFRGLQGVSVDSVRSIEGIDVCWIEEAHKVSERSLSVLIPTIRKQGSQIWASFNPELENDPIYKRAINPPENSIVIQISIDDNPWASAEMKAERDYDYQNDPDRARWVWGGECRKNSEAQIFAGKYSVQEFDASTTWDGPFYGVDFGFAPDPFVAVKIWLDHDQKRAYWEYEAGGTNIEIDMYPFTIAKIPGAAESAVVCDNARPESVSYLQNHDIPMARSCEKWPGCVEDGIVRMKSYHHVIHKRCKRVAEEFALYSHKVTKTGEILNDIEDKHNHFIDAGRYALEKWIRNKQGRSAPAPQDSGGGW